MGTNLESALNPYLIRSCMGCWVEQDSFNRDASWTMASFIRERFSASRKPDLSCIIPNTARCRYNVVYFIKSIHKRRPIARPLGQGMGCLLWIQPQIDILPQFLQWCVQYCYIGPRYNGTRLYHNKNSTHWGLNKLAFTLWTIFSIAFYWMDSFVLRFQCHWSLFLKSSLVQVMAWCWIWTNDDHILWHHMTSLGHNELTWPLLIGGTRSVTKMHWNIRHSSLPGANELIHEIIPVPPFTNMV